jgi:hypothetical protein
MRSFKEIGRNILIKNNKCKFCNFRSNEIDAVKKHEINIHSYYRNKKPRDTCISKIYHKHYGTKPQKNKPKLKHKYLFGNHLSVPNSNVMIDVLFEIYDNGRYRMFTDCLKYGRHKEIVFDNETQRYTIKGLETMRNDWNKKYGRNVNPIEREVKIFEM